MVNKFMFVGRLGRDPESRFTGGGSQVANFSIACDEQWKDKNGEKMKKTEWFRLSAWGKLAEICQQYLTKGSLVYVEGRISNRDYEKDGVKHYATDYTVTTMRMLGGGTKNGGSAPDSGDDQEFQDRTGGKNSKQQAASSEISDEDIPF